MPPTAVAEETAKVLRPDTALATAAAPAALWALLHARSGAVANWTAPTLPAGRHGPLHARTGGDGVDATVLLHGLISTGDVFGAAYDRLAATGHIVVPDLLGFGRSMDEFRSTFSVDDHLDALDDVATSAGLLTSGRWTIGAHSMGSALALRWAARHHNRVARVVCWGAPVYRSPDAARARIGGSTMARLFALDTDLAARACAISCRHRKGAGWLSAVSEPRLPVPVARAAPLHTWPAYRDAIRHLVIGTDWAELIRTLDRNGTPVQFVWGSRDRIGDRAHAAAIASQYSRVTVTSIDGAGHHLPMSHPQVCIGQLSEPA